MAKRMMRGTRGAMLAAASLLLAAGAVVGAHAEEAPMAPLSHTTMTVGGNSAVDQVDFGGTNSSPIAFVTDYGEEIQCALSVIEGQIEQGESVSVGREIGQLSDVLLTSCTATPFSFAVEATATTGTFEVRAHPGQPGSALMITIADLELHFYDSSGFCAFEATGSLDAFLHPGPYTEGFFTYDGGLELVPADFTGPSGFDLDITVPTGPTTCGGQIETGDRLGFWYDNESTGETSRYGLDTGGAGVISHG